MKSTYLAFLRKTILVIAISMLIVIPVFATWVSTLTEEDVKLWKMWINLAKNGYAEPMTINQPREKPWWMFWERW